MTANTRFYRLDNVRYYDEIRVTGINGTWNGRTKAGIDGSVNLQVLLLSNCRLVNFHPLGVGLSRC